MRTRHTRPALRSAQSGAALVIGLILLLVLTVLAVSSMSGATMGLQMTSNAQSANNSFQAAERAVDVAMATYMPDTTAGAVAFDPTDIAGTSDSYEYSIEFNVNNGVTEVPDGGFSLGEGIGFRAYHFDVTATGESTRGASTVTTQSYYVVGPSGG